MTARRLGVSTMAFAGLVYGLGALGCSGSTGAKRDLAPNAAGGIGGDPALARGGSSTTGGALGIAGAVVGAGGTAGVDQSNAAGVAGSSVSSGGSAGGAFGGSGASSADPFTFGVPPAAARYFRKGINLGNRLEAPNEGDWGGVIQSADFPFIAKRGFDHVRIPIRFSGHAAATAPYTIDPAFFARVDTVLDQAAGANLAVIIDLHAYDELALDVAAERNRFLGLWAQIADRYRGRPETVAFELYNEPNGQLDTAWNDLLLLAIQTIRASNPHRLLIVDSVFWADPTRLSVLKLPNDANLMASIHLYEPKLFTFQGMSWMGAPYQTTGVVFPGPPATPIVPVQAAKDATWANQWFVQYNANPAATNPSGPATIAAQMALINAYRQAQGRVVYNGEWGPQSGGALDSRARLVALVRQECEKANIGWAIWEDPVNMSLFDSAAGTWLTNIVDALLPP